MRWGPNAKDKDDGVREFMPSTVNNQITQPVN